MSLTLIRGSDAYDPYTGTTVGTHIRRRKPFYVDGTEVQSDLVEGARTNTLQHSEDLTNAIYNTRRQAVSLPTAFITERGINLGFVTETTDNLVHIIWNAASVTSGNTYTYSFHIKRGVGNRYARVEMTNAGATGAIVFQTVDLDTNTLVGTPQFISTGATFYTSVSTGIEAFSGGLVRVWLTFTSASTMGSTRCSVGINQTNSNTRESYAGNVNNGLYIGGLQMELGATPSTYIKTLASTVTRAADSLVFTDTGVFDTVNGTLALTTPLDGTVYSLPSSADTYTFPLNYKYNLVNYWNRDLTAGEETVFENAFTF